MNNPVKDLGRLLEIGLLHKPNAERLARVFYDATKIVYERQRRLGKKQLKMKEISSALLLSESIHSPRMFHFDATGALAGNFGHFDESAAFEYYQNHVMGQVVDKIGRTIQIDEDGLRSLYKEQGTGKHVVATDNYEQGRGKRLPWVRHILTNAESIYMVEETVSGAFRRSFLYFGVVSIPLDEKAQTAHHVVVVRENKNGYFRLLTAYSVFNRNRFLKILEPSQMHP